MVELSGADRVSSSLSNDSNSCSSCTSCFPSSRVGSKVSGSSLGFIGTTGISDSSIAATVTGDPETDTSIPSNNSTKAGFRSTESLLLILNLSDKRSNVNPIASRSFIALAHSPEGRIDSISHAAWYPQSLIRSSKRSLTAFGP